MPSSAYFAAWKLSKKYPRASPCTTGSMTHTPGRLVSMRLRRGCWVMQAILVLSLPSPFGRRCPEGADEGTGLAQKPPHRRCPGTTGPSSGAARHLLPEGEGQKLAFNQPQQILAVTRLDQRRGQFAHACLVDPALLVGDFLGTAHFQALPVFDGGDVVRCIDHRLMGAGVEPRVTAPELFQHQRTIVEIAT